MVCLHEAAEEFFGRRASHRVDFQRPQLSQRTFQRCARPFRGVSGGSVLRGIVGWRSEEHTSELQSLPTRRSSDLVAPGGFPTPPTEPKNLPTVCSPIPRGEWGLGAAWHCWVEIGRAHV